MHCPSVSPESGTRRPVLNPEMGGFSRKNQLLLCSHVKEPTKYPKSTDQISGGIWSTNETGFIGSEVDQYKHCFRHDCVDLQRIVTKFSQELSDANLAAKLTLLP